VAISSEDELLHHTTYKIQLTGKELLSKIKTKSKIQILGGKMFFSNYHTDGGSGYLRSSVNRREFLKHMGITTAALTLLPSFERLAYGQDIDPTTIIKNIHREMIVHNNKPVVMEAPVQLLRNHKITPKELLYIRSNQVYEECDKLTGMPLEGDIEIIGLVTVPYTLKVSDLKTMPQKEVEMVLQCSGNGRAFFSKIVKAGGTQWTRGGGGNIKFKGVPLKLLLEKAQVSPYAKYLTAEGKDSPTVPTASDFEKSVPLSEVIDKAILAIEMNGEPLPAVHGGPVRLVLPGFYGVNNIKWVKRIRLEAHETANVAQIQRYRAPNMIITPGEKFTFTYKNSTANWHQRIKSYIWAPLDGQEVSAGKVQIGGPAWNDGQAPLTSVVISVDRGRNWHKTELDFSSSPYAWSLWQTTIKLENKGTYEIWSRATDALGRTQPIDGTLFWNPKGYEWNGVDKIRITIG
jgi:sulfite oxidase